MSRKKQSRSIISRCCDLTLYATIALLGHAVLPERASAQTVGDPDATEFVSKIGKPKKGQTNEVYVTLETWKRVPLPPGEWEVVGVSEEGGIFKKVVVTTMINNQADSPFRLLVLRYSPSSQSLTGDSCISKANKAGFAYQEQPQKQTAQQSVETHGCSFFYQIDALKEEVKNSWGKSAVWKTVVESLSQDHIDTLPDLALVLEAEVHPKGFGPKHNGFAHVTVVIESNPARANSKDLKEQLSKGWAGAEPPELKLLQWRETYLHLMRQAFFHRGMPKSDALSFKWDTNAAETTAEGIKPWFTPAASSNEEPRPSTVVLTTEVIGKPERSEAASPTSAPQSDAQKATVSAPINEAIVDTRKTEAISLTQVIQVNKESFATTQAPDPPTAAPSWSRKALVIGNDTYLSIPKLRNARADARSLEKSLTGLGYKVSAHIDLKERDMKKAIRDFVQGISGGDEVVFYYAGHGVQINGVNFLLPTDMRADDERTVRDEAISLQRILDDMSDAKARLTVAIVDACRDNPFSGTGRSIGGRGLSPTSAATGQVILFSAGSGQQALDSVGPKDQSKNGLFTRTLLKHIDQRGVTIDRVMRTVRNEVAQAAKSVGHEQVPALYDQVIGDFYFAR